MHGSLRRIALVTRMLIHQNSVLVIFLLFWPCILSGILMLADHGRPQAEDAASILQQELFYGLVLVGFGSSVALGTEQRARRSQQVLGRAVSRTEYLLALGCASYLPFLGYTLVWLLNAAAFGGLLHLHTPTLLPVVLAEVAAGFLVCSVGLLSSTLLPQMGAGAACGLILAALFGAGVHGLGSVASVFGMVAGYAGQSLSAQFAGALLQSLAAAVVIAAVGCLVFTKRDLRLH